MRRKLLALFVIGCLLLLGAQASASPIGFVNSNIWISKTKPVAGDNTTLFAVLVNGSDDTLQGKVQFLDVSNNQAVGPLQSFTLSGGGTSNVIQTAWKAVAGNHQFKAKITEAMSVKQSGQKTAVANEILSESTGIITVVVDSDNDGLPDPDEINHGTNPNNPDTDGDGVKDGKEVGQGSNPLSKDTDKDGDPDGTDPNPTNPNIFTPPDTDKDGKPDSIDSDIDNDGLYNWDETGGAGKKVDVNWGGDQPPKPTDPYKYDTDGDGVGDKQDYYPLDPKRSKKPVEPAVAVVDNSADNIVATGSEIIATTSGQVLGEKIYNESAAAVVPEERVPWWRNLAGVGLTALVFLWLLLLLFFLYFDRRVRKLDEDENGKKSNN